MTSPKDSALDVATPEAIPGEPPTLVLRDVQASYGDTVVLRKVSLEVPPRAVVALLGPNGAGKTTVMRLVSGCLLYTSRCV